MKQPVKAALYMRLSRDDDDYGDSVSIETQRKIIRQFAQENNIFVVDEYVDDGWSGTNFERPAFKQMMEDTYSGKVNCIITKDLSRFGREHIKTDYYLEIDFPARNIRYIAVSDNEDTEKGLSDFVPFKNLFNEWFARDTSRKVKTAFSAKFHAGEHVCKYAPIGYMKDPQEKNHLIPNPETRWIIELIFSLAYQGNGYAKILRYLYEKQVPTPSWWIWKQYGTREYSFVNAPEDKRYSWSTAQLKNIITNPTYLGHSVHYTITTVSFKNKKRIKHGLDDCVIIENTHEPLVGKEVFDEVQNQIARRRRQRKDGTSNIFAGLLFCADCGHALAYNCNRQNKTPIAYYRCSQYANGINKCSIHYIRFDILSECLLNRIKYMIKTAQIDNGEILKKAMQQQKANQSNNAQRIHTELDRSKRRLKTLDDLFAKMYEDRISGNITERSFSVLSQKYQDEQEELEKKIKELTAKVDREQEANSGIEKLIEILNEQMNPEELTAQLLKDLVDKILVHEATKCEDGSKKQEIEIYWRFAGKLD